VSIRNKLGVGAALATVPVLALASPAAADTQGSARVEEDVTFPRDDGSGSTYTCTFIAGSHYRWDEESDITWITASNTASGSDPECSRPGGPSVDPPTEAQVLVTWTEPDEELPQSARHVDGTGRATGTFSVSIPVDGPATNIRVEHNWVFCDVGCATLTLRTAPK